MEFKTVPFYCRPSARREIDGDPPNLMKDLLDSL
jgi:hypothetical protein